MTEVTLGSDKLLKEAFSVLKHQLQEYGSVIDDPTEVALKTVQEHMVHMLVGELTDPKFFLSSLDPGKGKTEAVCALLKAWKAADFQPEGSVLISLSRLDEIRSYIDRSELDESDFAVLVNEKDHLNTRGRADRSEALVLFTTQEMLFRRTQAGSFQQLDCYHFRGQPRPLRIWDESLLLAQPITVRLDGIKALPEPLRPIDSALAEWVDALGRTVNEKAAGDWITVPVALAACQAERTRAALSPGQWENLGRLACLAGHRALLQDCNRYGRQLVSAPRRLPADFAPAVILDASGRVRHTYRVWQQHGDNMVRLAAAENDYSKLTVRHWNQAANKAVLSDPAARQPILQAVAKLINESPTAEEWLVIHHKAKGQMDVPQELKALVGYSSRVQFLHWGNHHGTNAYQAIRKVAVIGLWTYAEAAYAAHHLAALPGLEGGSVTKEEREGMKEGEHQHHLLQAICRANVRNSAEGVCGDCEVYMIGKLNPELLTETFPGATIQDWQPVMRKLRGRAADVAQEIERRFKAPETVSISKGSLWSAVGFSSHRQLSNVLNVADFQVWMASQGLQNRHHHIVRMAA